MVRGPSRTQVFLTRPQGRNGTVPERLRALDMDVHELPALELRPLQPTPPLPQPGDYDVVVFVSRYAVQRYLALWAADATRAHWPVGTLAATVGASSADSLRESSLIPPQCVVHPPADDPAQDSESLLAMLDQCNVRMHRVLIVRGSQGREWLSGTLAARGTHVDILPVYERVIAPWSPQLVATLSDALTQPDRCVFLLTSSEGVRAVADRVAGLGLSAQWARARFVLIHARIGTTLQSVLASPSECDARPLEFCTPDDDSIVEAIHAAAKRAAKP